ncbi:hypothetical protein FLSA109164_12070 [Flavobacterium saliperosum]
MGIYFGGLNAFMWYLSNLKPIVVLRNYKTEV